MVETKLAPLFPSESLKTRIKDMQGKDKVDENHGGSTIT